MTHEMMKGYREAAVSEQSGKQIIERVRSHVMNGNIEWIWRPKEVLDAVYQTLDECERRLA